MQSNSPCAACKIQRRKCTQECVFAPYFPPDQPQKFVNVHKVFGASNVSKLLQELSADSREDAVNSLAYEADARLRDPVYGCVGLISVLQQRLKQVHIDLITAKQELAAYLGPQNAVPFYPNPYMPHQGNPSSSSSVYNNPYSSIMGAPGGSTSHQLVIREPSQVQAQHVDAHQQIQQQVQAQVQAQRQTPSPHFFDAHQLAREHQQDMLMRLTVEQKMALMQQQQQQQQQRQLSQYQQRPVQQNLARFTTAHDPGTGPDDETAEFNEIGSNTSTAVGPGLVLGSGYQHPYDLVQQDQQQQSEHGQNPLQQLQREEDQLLFNNNPESPVLQLGPQTQLWHKFDDEEDRRNNINGPTS
ncbi:hypothetical protein F8388_017110 [Cannabis sativa]|uniref:LOB domain-containing protein n=1 Tax=Cannabis sativa TaxID=3483 RepID=A0A7J6I2T0_CANSA|nr:hypothetical protein F8388_017110 [Cannabis sativa]KAF4401872.1 hypothetical protein G4B88_017384 [Cannabis sativa]